MERIDGRLAYSATDLVDFLTCEHLSSLERAVAERVLLRPPLTAEDDLIFERGRVHESEQLARMQTAGRSIVEIVRPVGADGYARAMRETRAAIDAGVDAIVGATFVEGDFVGIADVLERRPQGPQQTLPGVGRPDAPGRARQQPHAQAGFERPHRMA